jgi:dihydrofolate reductase
VICVKACGLGAGGDRLFEWFQDGDIPSRYYPSFRMSAVSAHFFDEFAGRNGAVITGRRTYDIANAWGGNGSLPGVPLFVVTHRVPDSVPRGDPPYTFVTEGIERAVAQADSTPGQLVDRRKARRGRSSEGTAALPDRRNRLS